MSSSPVPPKTLPRAIRNKIKIALALKAYLQMKEGDSMKLKDQHIEMNRFFHGKAPTFPSQLQIFCNGGNAYRDFYESIHAVENRKNIPVVTSKL